MIKDIEENYDNSGKINDNKKSSKKSKNLLGKKHKKEVNYEDKLTNKLNKLDVNKESNNIKQESDSEYDEISDYESEEVYESCSENSEDYIEDNYENHINKKNNDNKSNINSNNHKSKNGITIWDESTHNPGKDDELVFDNSAYLMLHRSNVDWPCFSVDWIIPEHLYPQPFKNFYSGNLKPSIYKDEFPYTCYFLAGAQTSEKNGVLYLMKWFNLHKTLYDEDPDKEADSESEGAEPLMENLSIKTKGNVNRLKTMKNSYISAYWSDIGSVELIDLRNNIEELELLWNDDTNKLNNNLISKSNKKKKVESNNPHIKSFKKKDEGFAIDWNNINPGVFAVGGYTNEIDLHIPTDENCSDYISTSVINKDNIYKLKNNIKCHKGGVEDLFFSPNNGNLLASCGNDRSINIWDLRLSNETSTPAICIPKAHLGDVNCISWKISMGKDMIASGGDDSVVKIWDPRFMTNSSSVIADIQYHKSPITAIDFDPISTCQLAVTSEDHRLTIWDLSVEPDDDKYKDNNTNKDIPDQLVFLHQGQNNLKDVKFHPYYNEMLLSTAENGINIFKPNFNEDEMSLEDEDDFTFNK